MQKKRNSRGISHHLLLPIMAVLLVAGIGGYIMQRGSSAAAKTGWTSLGSASSGVARRQETVVVYKVAACKVAVSGNYKVRVRFTLSSITEPSNTNDRLQYQFTNFSVTRTDNDRRIGSGSTTKGAIRTTKSKIITTSKVSGATKVYAEATRSTLTSEWKHSDTKQVSKLLTCK